MENETRNRQTAFQLLTEELAGNVVKNIAPRLEILICEIVKKQTKITYSREEAAEAIGTTPGEIDKLRCGGELDCYDTPIHGKRFAREHIEAYLEKYSTASRPSTHPTAVEASEHAVSTQGNRVRLFQQTGKGDKQWTG